MPVVASGYIHQNRIQAAVEKAAQALRKDVDRIRFSLGESWDGTPAVFFRVVLKDKAVGVRPLWETAQCVSTTVNEAVRPDELGLESYFHYRTVAEQRKLKEPAWE